MEVAKAASAQQIEEYRLKTDNLGSDRGAEALRLDFGLEPRQLLRGPGGRHPRRGAVASAHAASAQEA